MWTPVTQIEHDDEENDWKWKTPLMSGLFNLSVIAIIALCWALWRDELPSWFLIGISVLGGAVALSIAIQSSIYGPKAMRGNGGWAFDQSVYPPLPDKSINTPVNPPPTFPGDDTAYISQSTID